MADLPECAHVWVPCIVGCDDCGEHPGVRCDGECEAVLDLCREDDPREV